MSRETGLFSGQRGYIITADVDDNPDKAISLTNDVKYMLATTSNDVGTLCTSKKIKVWSKHKPVHFPKMPYGATYTANGKTYQQWEGNNGNYGLVPYSITSGMTPTPDLWASGNNKDVIAALDALYDGDLNGWTYDRPYGTKNSPYRLTDFVKYYHGANDPIEYAQLSDGLGNNYSLKQLHKEASMYGSALSLVLNKPTINAGKADYEIGLADFATVNSSYPALLLINHTGNSTASRILITGDDSFVSNTSTQLTVNKEDLPDGTYSIYPMFINKKPANTVQTLDELATTAYTFYTMPTVYPISGSGMEVASTTMRWLNILALNADEVYATQMDVTTTLRMELNFVNPLKFAQTFEVHYWVAEMPIELRDILTEKSNSANVWIENTSYAATAKHRTTGKFTLTIDPEQTTADVGIYVNPWAYYEGTYPDGTPYKSVYVLMAVKTADTNEFEFQGQKPYVSTVVTMSSKTN